MDMSTIAPMRKPRRIPFLIHGLTRQPAGFDASGSAARTWPEFKASLNDWKSAKCCCPNESGTCAKSSSICSCSMHSPREAQRFERALDSLEVFGSRPDQRQTPDGFEQSHRRHGCLHRTGIGFDEIHFHQREILFLELARLDKISFQAGVGEARHLRGNFVGHDGNHASSTERDY